MKCEKCEYEKQKYWLGECKTCQYSIRKMNLNSDNFVPKQPEILTKEESWLKNGTKYPGGPRAAYEQGFMHSITYSQRKLYYQGGYKELVESMKGGMFSTDIQKALHNLKKPE